MGLNKIGRAIKATGAMKCWKDGDGVAFVWRWWHPVSWLLVPIMLLASVLIEGIPSTFRNLSDLGLGLSPWWKSKKNERQFF